MRRLSSVIALLRRSVRRALYRRADLWRLAPVMVDERSSSTDRFRWVNRDAGGPETTLECPSDSAVTYAVTLPANATVVSWCALAGGPPASGDIAVTFEIEVRGDGFRSAAHRTVTPPGSRARRWHALSVRVGSHAGAAHVTFRTRSAAPSLPDGLRALWGQPCIETPRPVGELLSTLRTAVTEAGIPGLWHAARPPSSDALYRQWVRAKEPTDRMRAEQRAWAATVTRRFSVITVVDQPHAWDSSRAGATMLAQTFPHWEWILVVASATPTSLPHLPDPRMRVIRVSADTSLAARWNAGLGAARGEFAGLLGQHDQLAPSALYEMARTLERSHALDLVYSDEDRIGGAKSRRHEPCFKPDWSPELLLSSNYIGRLFFVRVDSARAAGGFRDGFDGAEEWDLLLRVSRQTARISRVPRCLYHRDQNITSNPTAGGDLALGDHFAQRGFQASVTSVNGARRAVWRVRGTPMVSVIVPNRDAAAVFATCVAGVLEKTSYTNVELVVVDNSSSDPMVLDLYRSLERKGRTTVVPFEGPFNYSAACNRGAAAAGGDLFLFLNNDIEVLDPAWLEELVRWAQLPEVGVVGAKLLFPDRTVQHAGVVFGVGLVGHIFGRGPEGTPTLFGSTESYRNYLAVTGACQMMRRDVFQKLGGYDERFRLVFSDVVLCMRAWDAGYRVVYTPYARLVHHESHTRKRDDSAEDMELLARHLRASGFGEDPYFHPELNPKSAMPALRPPLEASPRQVVEDYVDRVLVGAERRAVTGARPAEAP